MTLDIVRQGDTKSCWTACLSTLTGIDYDILPKEEERQLAVYPVVHGGGKHTLKRMRRYRYDEVPSLADWNAVLKGHYKLTWSREWDGRRCIVGVWWQSPFGGRYDSDICHAIILDTDGTLYDPADDIFEGERHEELLDACNVSILNYIYVEERE